FGCGEIADTACGFGNRYWRPTGAEPWASPWGCLSLRDIKSRLAEFTAPQDTTTISPRKTSGAPATSATTCVTAVPAAFVSSFTALALRSSVTLANSRAGRTTTHSATP